MSINHKVCFCGGYAAFFVFPLTCATEKHLISEKPLIQRFFKGTGVVLAGIECSPKIRDFRANGIPVQDRVVFFDTLRAPNFGAFLMLIINLLRLWILLSADYREVRFRSSPQPGCFRQSYPQHPFPR